MTDPEKPKSAEELTALLAAEKKALDEAPVVKVVLGPVRRCSLCGQPSPIGDLELIETPLQGEPARYACRPCWSDEFLAT